MSTDKSNKQKINLFMMVVLALVVGFGIGAKKDYLWQLVAPALGFQVQTRPDWDSLDKIYRVIKADFDGEIDDRKILTAAQKGIVAGLGDEHSYLMTKEESSKFNEQITGDIGGGIGAEIGIRKGNLTIVRLLENNPAARSGLVVGDVIVKVNDETVIGQELEPVVAKIRGQVGSQVRLTVLRSGQQETQEYAITRALVDNPSVTWKMEEQNMLITVYRFDNKTANLMRQAANEFKLAQAKGVILDLRSNAGGYLEAARQAAGLWLDNQLVTIEKKYNQEIGRLRSPAGEAEFANIPTVVLLDNYSASASEILAGALKDHQQATIIGQTSYGKGSVQELLPFNGGQLKLTIAHWFTPLGTTIDKIGIKPDLEVTNPDDAKFGDRDRQLEAALRHLAK